MANLKQHSDKRKALMKKELIIIPAISVIAVLAFGAQYIMRSSSTAETTVAALEHNTFASLSGFKADTVVVYKILSKDAEPIEAQGIVDKFGFLNIPIPEGLNKLTSDLAYDFSIRDKDQTLSLSLRQNEKTGLFSIYGQGDDSFANIEITAAGENIKTRTDWAGLFEETGIQLGFNKKNRTNEVQVAFFNANIASDAGDYRSPALIKIASSLGPIGMGSSSGGGVGDAHNDAIRLNYIEPMQKMVEQISAVAMQQVFIIGSFFDAKDQLEVQRLHQTLRAEAVKDYHPSEQMCRIGSYVRSLATNERKAIYDHIALSDILMETFTSRHGGSSENGSKGYLQNRVEQFKTTYCDPNDNKQGLILLCEHDEGIGAKDINRRNKDIDFQRTVDFFSTLDVDFTDGQLSEAETDIIALGRNLYWPDSFDFFTSNRINENPTDYQKARQLIALSNLAQNSYAKIISMKARAPEQPEDVIPGWAHMKTMMRSFGMSDDAIEMMIGERPGYNAQMEILTKKMYQNPDFYTNLYAKPTNVDRVITSLSAISLMQQRDMHEASMRREMLLSGMIENELITDSESIQGSILEIKNQR